MNLSISNRLSDSEFVYTQDEHPEVNRLNYHPHCGCGLFDRISRAYSVGRNDERRETEMRSKIRSQGSDDSDVFDENSSRNSHQGLSELDEDTAALYARSQVLPSRSHALIIHPLFGHGFMAA